MKPYLHVVIVFFYTCIAANAFAQCEVDNIPNQTVCNLSTTAQVNFTGTATTFTWINDQPSIGLIPGGTGNIPAFTAINLGTSPVVATITVTPSTGACTGTAKSFTITVNPTPTVNPVSDQVACNGTSTSLITFSGSGTTYTWSNDNPSIGLSGSGSGNIAPFTAINTGTSPLVANLTVTPIKNGCSGAQQHFTITVNPSLTPSVSIASSPAANKICPHVFVTFIATATNTGGGTVIFTWKVNSSIKKIGAENFYGKNNWNEGDLVTCIITVSNGTCVTNPGTASDTFTIHLRANITPTVEITASDDSICIGNQVTFTASTNLDAGDVDTFLFKINGNSVPSGTDSFFTTSSLANNDLVTCEIKTSGCVTSNTATSNTILMTVATPLTPSVTISTPETAICSGSEATFTANAINTGGGIVNYQFKVNGVPQASVGNTFSTSTLSNNDTVSCKITLTNYTCLSSNIAFSNNIVMSVVDSLLPLVSLTASTGNTICSGAEVTFSADALQTGGSLLLYNFKVNGDIVKNGIDSFYITNSLSNADTIICEINITQGACFSADTAVSDPIIMVVKPTPDVNPVSDQIYCNDSSTTLIAFTGSVSGTTYSWTNSNSSIGLAGNGTDTIFSFSVTDTSDTLPAIAAIVVTPTKDLCPGIPDTFTITVNPTPTIDTVGDQIVCNGDTTTAVSFQGNISGTTFDWINLNPSIGLIGNGTGDIPSFTAINSGTSPVVATIIVTPSKDACPGQQRTFTIAVNPTPIVNVTPDQIFCNDSSTELITFTGNITDATYNWEGTNSNIGLGVSGSDSIPATTLINLGTSAIVDTITVTPINLGCPGTPKSFTITVNPTPTVIATPAQQPVCNGSPTVAISFTGNIAGTTYNWINYNTSIGLIASGSGDIPEFTAINSGISPVIDTIIVTPTRDGCPGVPEMVTITVKPTPTVTVDSTDQSVCNGFFTQPVTFSGSGTSYTWTNFDTSLVHSDSTSGTGNFPAFLATNSDTVPHPATITVTPWLDGCDGISESFTITVNPTPFVEPIPDTTYCNGEPTGNIVFSSKVDNLIYYWTVTGDNIGLESGNGYYLQNFVATNKDSTVKTAVISVHAIANGCQGPDSSFTITVNPSPPQPLFTSLLLNIYPVTLCQGSENVNFNINTPATSSEIQYKWSSSIPAGIKIGDDNNPNTVISFFNTGTYNIIATVTNKPNLGSCNASESQTVFVKEKTDTLAERDIILKNPGNLLIYPDNSMYHFDGYQWGYDTMVIVGVDTSLGRAHAIEGQVYQFFIPDSKFIDGNSLNTHDYAYWVLLKPDTCQTKVYYNGPYAHKRLGEEMENDPEVRVNVYPNPNNGSFIISLSGNIYGNIDAKISNTLGQLIYRKTFQKIVSEAFLKIEDTGIPEGLYLLELQSDDHPKISTRIIITR